MKNSSPRELSIKEFKQGKVLVFSLEDDLETEVKPRLKRMGAIEKNIFYYTSTINLGDDEGFSELEECIKEIKPLVIIFDPFVAGLNSKSKDINMNQANHTRPILGKLAWIAKKYNLAIINVIHVAKHLALNAVHAGIGSQDINAAARSLCFLGKNPKNPDERAFVHLAANGVKEGDTISFQIDQDPKDPFKANFKVNGFSEITYEDIVNGDQGSKYPADARTEAEEAILDALSSGGMKEPDLKEYVTKLGISESSYKRARANLKRKKKKEGDGDPLIQSKAVRDDKGKIQYHLYSLYEKDEHLDLLDPMDSPELVLGNQENQQDQENAGSNLVL